MARNWTLCRQDAEALVELLESNEDFQIHDKTALEAAAELREMFGMATLAEERKALAKRRQGKKSLLNLNVEIYNGDFSEVVVAPHKAWMNVMWP